MLRRSIYHRILIATVFAAIVGCAAGPREPSAKAKAADEWNAARAGVLGNLAADQYKSGDFDKSRQTLNEALKLTPENAPLHLLAGKLAIEAGQLEPAEQELATARRFAPADAEAYYLSGIIYQRWQKPQTAFDFYQKAADRAPAELAYVLAQAEMLVAMNRTSEALSLLQGKVVYFEHSGAIRDAVGQLLMQSGKYADAVAMFREAGILSEEDLSVREHLSFALYADANYRECAQTLNRLLNDKRYAARGDLFVMLGQCQLHLDNPRAARLTFETATQLSPDSARAWLGLGQSALQVNDDHRAGVALARSVSLDRDDSDAQLALGYLRLKENRPHEALESFKEASALDAKDTVSVCMIGVVQEKLGQHAAALKSYRQALSINAEDELALSLIASVDAGGAGD